MTNHCTPELFKAIDNLERRYPSVFKSQDKYSLDDVVPPLDPDFRIIKDFRDTIREHDWERYHSDRGLESEIASCLHRRMGVHEIAEHLNTDSKTVSSVIKKTPRLKKISAKNRRSFSRVVIFDRQTGKYAIVSTMYYAAHKLGIPLASIKFYANDRHCKYWINNRYKIKRKVWFDEDNGM